MRTILCMFFLSLVILGCGQKKNRVTGWNYNDAQTDVYYGMKIPDKKNMKDEKPRIIWLEPNKREHFITFGMFDSETNWKIYDWLNYQASLSELPPPLLDTNFTINQESVINISSLDTGKYMVCFTAFAEGCNFELTIKKKPTI